MAIQLNNKPPPKSIRETFANYAKKVLRKNAKNRKARENAEGVLGEALEEASKVADYESMQKRKLKQSCGNKDWICIVAYRPQERSEIVYFAENHTYYDIDLRLEYRNIDEFFVQSVGDKEIILPPMNASSPSNTKISKELDYSVRVSETPMPGFQYYLGDPAATHNYSGYSLPFSKGKQYECTQGFNNSNGTHGNMHAVDFKMPVGTSVLSARSGRVVFIGRGRRNAWIVKIRHDDGTYGVYVHLKVNSETVGLGDTLDVGDQIAQSGNSGNSSGPHLHFHVNKADGNGDWETVSWEFSGTNVEINGQDTSGNFIPKSGKKYKAVK